MLCILCLSVCLVYLHSKCLLEIHVFHMESALNAEPILSLLIRKRNFFLQKYAR
jgi:hypothetical protein